VRKRLLLAFFSLGQWTPLQKCLLTAYDLFYVACRKIERVDETRRVKYWTGSKALGSHLSSSASASLVFLELLTSWNTVSASNKMRHPDTNVLRNINHTSNKHSPMDVSADLQQVSGGNCKPIDRSKFDKTIACYIHAFFFV